MKFDYIKAKVFCKLTRVLGWEYSNKHSKLIMKRFFEKSGISVGENCAIFSDIRSSESYLISIGNNVTISNDVQFITHDNCLDRVLEDKSDVFGRINIGSNCFIGMRTLIMPGVTLNDKTIVGGGSVVTKSFNESEIIIAGNPAKKIGTWDELIKKYEPIAFGKDELCKGVFKAIQDCPEKIIRNR